MNLRDVSTLLAVVIGACYAVGLLATNLYLHELEIAAPDPTVLRARYIYTGAVAVGVVALTFSCVAYARTFLHSAPTTRAKRIVVATGAVALPLGLLLAFMTLLTHAGAREAVEETVSLAFAATVGALLTAQLVTLVHQWGATKARRRPKKTRLPPWSLAVLLALSSVFFLGMFVWRFSEDVLPHLPQHFGGAKPETGRLLVVAGARPSVELLGVTFSCDTSLSDPVSIVFDLGDSLVLKVGATPSERYSVISKSLIVGSTSPGTCDEGS